MTTIQQIKRKAALRKPCTINELLRTTVLSVYDSYGCSPRKTAETLGISERTLFRWLSKWQIKRLKCRGKGVIDHMVRVSR